MNRVKLTILGVATFIVVGLFALAAERANAESNLEDGFYLDLGRAVANSDSTVGGAEFRYNKWSLGGNYIGHGTTKYGQKQDQTYAVSFSRLVDPGWHIGPADYFMRLGVAYIDDSRLVEEANYRLGVGFDLGVWELEWTHYSSAGANPLNTGIDFISIRVDL